MPCKGEFPPSLPPLQIYTDITIMPEYTGLMGVSSLPLYKDTTNMMSIIDWIVVCLIRLGFFPPSTVQTQGTCASKYTGLLDFYEGEFPPSLRIHWYYWIPYKGRFPPSLLATDTREQPAQSTLYYWMFYYGGFPPPSLRTHASTNREVEPNTWTNRHIKTLDQTSRPSNNNYFYPKNFRNS